MSWKKGKNIKKENYIYILYMYKNIAIKRKKTVQQEINLKFK